MVRTSTLPRVLAAALAIAAFSAQAAGAQSRQDLRSPDTQAAAVEASPRSSRVLPTRTIRRPAVALSRIPPAAGSSPVSR